MSIRMFGAEMSLAYHAWIAMHREQFPFSYTVAPDSWCHRPPKESAIDCCLRLLLLSKSVVMIFFLARPLDLAQLAKSKSMFSSADIFFFEV